MISLQQLLNNKIDLKSRQDAFQVGGACISHYQSYKLYKPSKQLPDWLPTALPEVGSPSGACLVFVSNRYTCGSGNRHPSPHLLKYYPHLLEVASCQVKANMWLPGHGGLCIHVYSIAFSRHPYVTAGTTQYKLCVFRSSLSAAVCLWNQVKLLSRYIIRGPDRPSDYSCQIKLHFPS